MHLGLVGLGKMGGNMRTRLRNGGITVVGYDRNPDVSDSATLAEMVEALPSPKVVWVMVPAGEPTRATIAELGELLGDGDLVVDGGNSKYTDDEVNAVAAREREYLDARVARLRPSRSRLPLDGRTVVIVDDGVATGATARVACDVARRFGATTVILAVPVIAASTLAEMTGADDIVYVAAPDTFWAVGQFYTDFSATTDEEVARLLDESARRPAQPRRPDPPAFGAPT